MKTKKLAVLLTAAVMSVCSFASACGSDNHTHKHVYEGDWTVAEADKPTETSTGKAKRYCTSDDGGEQILELPALSDSRYVITNNSATATADGYGTYTITVDGVTVSFFAVTPATGSGEEGGNQGGEEGGEEGGNQGGGNEEGGGEDLPEPTIPVSDTIKITKAAGDLETAYLEWEALKDAEWYNVYYRGEEGSFVKLDDQLVRAYSACYRADAVGLKAGIYSMKIVPVNAAGEEMTSDEVQVDDIAVLAHDRSGFGFVGGSSSGAYNDDGTLKDDARVIYITENTKNTVSLEITGATANPCVGLQTILDGFSKGKESRPLAVRFVGNITDPTYLSKGDLQLDTKSTDIGITLEGIGSDATANGWGIRIKNAVDVEIRNLGFMNCDSEETDCVGLQQNNNHIWVHNCDFFYGHAGSDSDQKKGDGALDSKGSDYVTHSYNHFYDSGKCNLLGNGTSEEGTAVDGSNTRLTYHHNWYDHSDSRHPRIRSATVHVYNNYFDGNAKYGVGVTRGASAFVENNYFRSTARMRPMLAANQGTDISDPNETGQMKSTFGSEDGGTIKSFGNIFDGDNVVLRTQNSSVADSNGVDCWEASSRDEQVPSTFVTLQGSHTYNNFDTAPTMYSYQADTAEEARDKVMKYAGRVEGGDFTWDFDDATEDGNSEVIEELKTAIVNYTSGLVKVGGDTVGGGTTTDGSGGTTDSDGGESGGSGETSSVVEGTVTYNPATDGATGNEYVTVTGNIGGNTTAVTVNGVTIPAKAALKLESSTNLSFTTTEEMILTLYVSVASIKVDEVKRSGVASGDYYVVTLTLSAGSHTVTKDDTGQLYLLTLTPVGSAS